MDEREKTMLRDARILGFIRGVESVIFRWWLLFPMMIWIGFCLGAVIYA